MLSLVLPTYNEAENIRGMVEELSRVLKDVPSEIIVVDDDSPDETWRIAQELAASREDLRVIRRIDRRGLSSAVIDGFLAAKGSVLAVMDADGQHDAALIVALYKDVKDAGGIAIGSRYVEGGSVGSWDERRHMLSRIATRLAIALCKVKVHDPMSGYFAIARTTFEDTLKRLNPKGFKILLDFLVHVDPATRVQEFPLTFHERRAGESKLSRRVQIEFLEYLYDVTLGRWIPLLFVKYCIVGTLGVGVHLAAYYVLSRLIGHGADLTLYGFSLAVMGATETAIIFNFLLNNAWTFKNVRLRGVAAVVGFLKFNVACVLGAVANVAVSTFLFSQGWYELASVAIGALVGVVWNYTMNKIFTWRV